MSKTYSAKVVFPLKYINMPERRMVVSDLPRRLEVVVKTTGFQILAHRLGKKEDTLVFDVEAKLQGSKDMNKDVVIIPSKALTADLAEVLDNDLTVTGFYPDSVVFNFASKARKIVPVRFISQINFEKQFDSTSHPAVIPDSVAITGPDSVIRNIQFVETLPLLVSKVKSTISVNLKMRRDSFVTVIPDQVLVKIPVEKFTEGTLEVPVHVVNVKRGYTVKTFPDKITVQYQVPLSRYNSINPAMFDAVADAAGLPDNNIQEIKINLISPETVRMASAFPDKVDYILRKK